MFAVTCGELISTSAINKQEDETFCGASCSGTSQSSSEAAGSCMPSNCLSKPMATDSAELDWRKEGELKTHKWRERKVLKTSDDSLMYFLPSELTENPLWGLSYYYRTSGYSH